MATPLKQSTAVTLQIGPFMDEDDGKTPENALTISQADVRLSKNGGAFAQKNNASDCTNDENGFYTCPLSTTDTNTLGILKLVVHESGTLPVWQDFAVMPANVYDSLYSTDKLQVDVVESSTPVAVASVSGAVGSVTGAVGSVTGAVGSVTGSVGSVVGHTPQTGDTYALANGATGFVAIDTVVDTISTNVSALNDFNPTTDTVANVTLVATTTTNTDMVAAAPTAAANADAVWDEARAGHVGAGSFGQGITSVQGDIQGDLLGSITGIQAGLIDSTMFAAGAIDASALATDAVAEIADGVWDEAIAGHTAGGSTGEALGNATAPTAAVVADAVWDEAIAGHVGAGSTGASLNSAGSGADAATIAAAVWDETVADHTVEGPTPSFGYNFNLQAYPTKEQIADQVWVEILSGHSGTSGSTAEALSNAGGASLTVNVAPTSVGVNDLADVQEDIIIYQTAASPNIAFTVLDADGDAVDVSGKALRFNAVPVGSTTASWSRDSASGEITMSVNVATVTYTTTDTATTGNFTYYLWNTTDDELLKWGSLIIRPATKTAAT